VSDIFGCSDTLCQQLIIIPAEIENLNIITPNGDNSNDVLYFDYVDTYNETELTIFNRWGNLVFQASPYLNNWSGDGLTDGVYFYLLKIKDTNKTYSSFFHLMR
jgi:gliding motility-associated-like protein